MKVSWPSKGVRAPWTMYRRDATIAYVCRNLHLTKQLHKFHSKTGRWSTNLALRHYTIYIALKVSWPSKDVRAPWTMYRLDATSAYVCRNLQDKTIIFHSKTGRWSMNLTFHHYTIYILYWTLVGQAKTSEHHVLLYCTVLVAQLVWHAMYLNKLQVI